jgi:hypothetical protein
MKTSLILLLALASAPPAAEDAGPMGLVVLQDGSWLRLETPPRVRDERLELTLYPSGLSLTIALDSLDAEATEAANRGELARPRDPTLTWGTAPAPFADEGPPALDEDAAAALSERWSRDAARLHREQRHLRRALAAIEEDARRFERDLERNLTRGSFAGALAAQLRRVVALRDTVGWRLERVESDLAALYEAAARRSIPIRPVP